MRSKRDKGFTLIELMMVIAIVGFLSSIVIASMNSARNQAHAAKILRDIAEIKKAMLLLADDENRTTWWRDTLIDTRSPSPCTVGGNPDSASGGISITCLVTDSARLGKYLGTAPVPVEGGYYIYDFDNNNSTPCQTSANAGVNISIQNLTNGIRDAMESLADKGDGDRWDLCGRINWNTSVVNYKLGWNAADMFN